MAKILHVFGRLNRAGAETLILNVYRHIDRSKVQFDVAVHSDSPGELDGEFLALGGKIFPLEKPGVGNLLAYRCSLEDTLRKNGPYQGIHSHVFSFSGYILAAAAKAGVPIRIAHAHSTSDGRETTLLRKVYRWYMHRLILKHATHLLGCSVPACQSLFGFSCEHNPRVSVLHNGIDLTLFEGMSNDRYTLKRRLSLPIDGPLIGHVGRFSQAKNHRFLIEVFSGLLRKLPNAHLILVGDGPLRKKIEDLVQQKQLGGNVHFLGTRADVPQLLAAFNLFLFPSVYEGFPLALVEAQAAGVPCLASTGVTREVDAGIGLFQAVDLETDLDIWIQRSLEALETARPAWDVRKKAMQEASFDILSAAQALERLYIEQAND